MNILVTGGAGYIGKVFINKYFSKFNKIFVLDNLYDSYNRNFPNNVTFINSDFGSSNKLDKIFSNDIECVFHFAAYARIGESNSNPAPFFDNNVSQMILLLNKMNEHNCKKIIFSSSASVFGNPEYLPVDEKHKKSPMSSYGETKLFGEKILSWYYKAYDIKSISLRYFNAAGAFNSIGEDRKHETHILPILFNSILFDKTFNIFGNDYKTPDGTCIRDYIHVEDLVDAHLLAYEKLNDIKYAKLNLGSEKGISNLEIVKYVSDSLGANLNYKFLERRPGDPDELVASSDKAKKILSWKNKYTFQDIINSLINYYKIK